MDKEKNSAPQHGKLEDTKTTGSGITKFDKDRLDGTNSDEPLDPKAADYPGNDSRH